MINYDKVEIKEKLTIENIFDLLQHFGAYPEYAPFGILSSTICHNTSGEGSRKLYYYSNSGLFRCFTSCSSSFDIFDLIRKIFLIQKNQELTLNEAVRWVADYFGIIGTSIDENEFSSSEDWEKFNDYERISQLEIITPIDIELKTYDKNILNRFNYKVKILPWEKEGITKEVMLKNYIGYYPGGEQITIPHFNINGELVGLRGRTLIKDEAEIYGKYRPIKINGQYYNHPLGRNLYNLNNSKNNIAILKKAIIYEGEKSSLKHQSIFGIDNDISVACCGSSVSAYQIKLLMDLGAQEIIVAFDREGATDDKKKYVDKFYKLNNKYRNEVLISFMYDKKGEYLDYKESPIDAGQDIFWKLFKERIII